MNLMNDVFFKYIHFPFHILELMDQQKILTFKISLDLKFSISYFLINSICKLTSNKKQLKTKKSSSLSIKTMQKNSKDKVSKVIKSSQTKSTLEQPIKRKQIKKKSQSVASKNKEKDELVKLQEQGKNRCHSNLISGIAKKRRKGDQFEIVDLISESQEKNIQQNQQQLNNQNNIKPKCQTLSFQVKQQHIEILQPKATLPQPQNNPQHAYSDRYNEEDKMPQNLIDCKQLDQQNYLPNQNFHQWANKYQQQIYDNILKSKGRQSEQTISKHNQIQQYDEFKQDWKQFVGSVLQEKGFDQLQFDNPLRKSGQHQLFNRLFIKRSSRHLFTLDNRQLDKPQIYLTSYTFRVLKLDTTVNCILAYSLTISLKPNLLWFSLIQNPPPGQTTLLNCIQTHSSSQVLCDILNKSITYMQIKSVHFIYTNFDPTLMTSLQWLVFRYQKLQQCTQISFQMHFQCLKRVFKKNVDKQLLRLLGERVNVQIQELGVDFGLFNNMLLNQIQAALVASKRSRVSCQKKVKLQQNQHNQTYQSQIEPVNPIQNAPQSTINPRQIFQTYKIVSQLFSSLSQNHRMLLNFQFLSSSLFIQKQYLEFQDSVYNINVMLSKVKFYQIPEQNILFIVDVFERQKLGSEREKLNNYLADNNWIKDEHRFLSEFDQIFRHRNFRKMFDDLFKQPCYEFHKIISFCPRYLIQVLYRLIILFDSIKIQSLRRDASNSQFFIARNSITNEEFKVNSRASSSNQHVNHSDNQNGNSCAKKWQCQCNFYKYTGIPCEHELFCSMVFKTSLFDQIHDSYKSL